MGLLPFTVYMFLLSGAGGPTDPSFRRPTDCPFGLSGTSPSQVNSTRNTTQLELKNHPD